MSTMMSSKEATPARSSAEKDSNVRISDARRFLVQMIADTAGFSAISPQPDEASGGMAARRSESISTPTRFY
ncbi:MAG TPA: hypothetical protein VFN77_11155 [Acetobacteraceae bacterium]|nr:hypothetical protein [Acetobacteraceae bacterium]